MKNLTAHFAEVVVPTSTDPASQDTIRDLQQQVANLTQRLQHHSDASQPSQPAAAQANFAKATVRQPRQSALVFPAAKSPAAPTAAAAVNVSDTEPAASPPVLPYRKCVNSFCRALLIGCHSVSMCVCVSGPAASAFTVAPELVG